MLVFRESDEIREIKSVDGKTYYLQKSAMGFNEAYTFYDENNNEIECFCPDYSHEIDGVYEHENSVLFEGRHINAEFANSEFYK